MLCIDNRDGWLLRRCKSRGTRDARGSNWASVLLDLMSHYKDRRESVSRYKNVLLLAASASALSLRREKRRVHYRGDVSCVTLSDVERNRRKLHDRFTFARGSQSRWRRGVHGREYALRPTRTALTVMLVAVVFAVSSWDRGIVGFWRGFWVMDFRVPFFTTFFCCSFVHRRFRRATIMRRSWIVFLSVIQPFHYGDVHSWK